MGSLVKYALIFLASFIIKVQCQSVTIEEANPDVNVTALPGTNSYLVSMNENNHDFDNITETPHTLLFEINDATEAITSISFTGTSFAYSVEESSEDGKLYFYASQSFDYETQATSYLFNIIVDASSGRISTLVRFNIINIDDEPPSLTSPQCTFDENTIYTKDNSTCSCTVSDPDGWLAQMTFEIVPNTGGEETLFALEYRDEPDDALHESPVYVTVKQELNYQEVTFYLFDIRAKDGANHSTIPNELVRAVINVNDLPDTPPEWTNYFKFQQFEEQQEQTFSVTAVDGDHGLNWEINYLKLWEDDEEADYISIDKIDGTINVKPIDRDKDDITMYNFAILSYKERDPLFNTSLDISFYIIDIDNNPPLIRWIENQDGDNVTFDEDTSKSTVLSFYENYAGNLNLTIYIRDIDTGENAQFAVELENLEDNDIAYTEAFLIVPTAGYRSGGYQISVKNATYLDYEVPEWVHITFNVLTKGTLNETKLDRMLVDITLIDYNDEFPIFAETEYIVEINETAKIGTEIIQVEATDRDAEDKVLNHTLIGSTYTNRVLAIKSDTGYIYVNAEDAFDYDTVNPVFVQVRATDKVGHTATVPVTINLLDVNNKAPTISGGDPINVDENQIIGELLNSTITASDMDTTAELVASIDWESSYATKNSRRLDMTNETIAQQVKFLNIDSKRIDPDDDSNRDILIVLTVNDNNPNQTAPDYELFDSLFLNVVVTDLMTDPEFMDKQNTSAIILISINDINDNIPFFPEANVPEDERDNRTVQENAPGGTSAGSIIAIDLDVDDTVTYECTALDPDFDWLDIHNTSGAFTVKDSNLIDADTHKTFYFYYSCVATDGDPTHYSDPLQVGFYIIDTNNKVPTVTIPVNVTVDEKSKEDVIVHEIDTSDEDRDIPFHTVLCRFTDSTSECASLFKIQNNVVKVMNGGNNLDRDNGTASYDCQATCRDNPDNLQNDQNPHSVPVSFTIVLNDINDHTPIVVTDTIKNSENLAKDEIVDIILATDIDAGDNAEIVFNITEIIKVDDEDSDYSDLFDVVTDEDYRVNDTFKQTNLVALKDLIGLYGTYKLKIGVADKGTPPRSDFYSVSVEIEKFNFEAPQFVFPADDNQNFILLSSQQQNSPLILFRTGENLDDIRATDNSESDVCNKWDIQFSFNQISPDELTIFTIDNKGNCAGELQINDRFNSNDVLGKTYNLELIAGVKDGEEQEGEAPYTTSRTVAINFLDNNQKPVFGVPDWEFKFFEEDVDQSQDLEYKASYEIEDEEELLIFYFLVTDNATIARIFNVDEKSGKISLTEKLDYETDHEFKFQIVASNDTTPSSNNPNSYLSVTVKVIDINDNVPQWDRANYFGAIMQGYVRNTPVLTLLATDLDEIDKDKLTYHINGTISASDDSISNLVDPFIVGEQTGEVRLNFQIDATMSGYFEFDVSVWDVVDPYGNGPHVNTTTVRISIITSDNTVAFRFYNNIEKVQQEEVQMLDIISNILNYGAHRQSIEKDTQDDVDLDEQTIASLYFIDEDNVSAVEGSTILRLVSNINTFSQLVSDLRNKTDLILMSFPSNDVSSENLEQVLKAWLVGVSVVLGALCLILLVTFILKTRELNNRINKLTNKFGSQESGLNRLGIAVPTTNKHAVEGSNPIFNVNSEEIKRDLRDYDEASIRSGDSDLIGIEDNPEFDYGNNRLRESSEYF